MDRSTEIYSSPTPDDFDAYISWACGQLMLPGTVVFTKVVQNAYVTYQQTEKKSKPKAKQSKAKVSRELGSDLAKEDKSISALQPIEELNFEKLIHIQTMYDQNENLVQIKFNKCGNIPCEIFKVMALIMQFHTYCTNITINRGIDNNSLIEIRNVVETSNVTDLCLDDTIIINAYYHILLEQPNKLRYLSLCRCKITDEQVEKIAETITYPEPSSTSLTILNLASNKITDIGAKCIAVALRSNRQLAYLNISDNVITDEGAIPIFTCLGEFPLTTDELKEYQKRSTMFLKNKRELVSQFFMELKSGDAIASKSMKNRYRKSKCPPPSTKIKKGEKEMSKGNLAAEIQSNNYETNNYEKCKAMADAIVGEFYDPFSPKETSSRDYQVYSTGNYRLSYINIAYNNITVLSLKKLLKVLVYQNADEAKGRGLVNVNLDGNYLPKTCMEMVRINEILQSAMVLNLMQGTAAKKKFAYNQKK